MNASEQLHVLIENQQRAVRWYAGFAFGLFALGIVVFIVSALAVPSTSPDSLKAVLGIAGAFVSSISAFPLKEVNACRDRLAIYRGLSARTLTPATGEVEKIDALVWEVLRKVALG